MYVYGEMPEELKAILERQHMEAQADRADLDRLIETMNVDDLLTVRKMIRITANSGGQAAAFFEGQIYARLRSAGLCTDCGQPDHDHEALVAQLSESGSEDIPVQLEFAFPGELSDEDRINMATYNIDDLRDEDTGELLGFICLGCGMRYPSIADRMLRRPDECSGCWMKSAHG